MANKKCLIYETLGSVSDLQVQKSNSNEVRLSGVFGVCGVRNQNRRIYNKENYGRMVEELQQVIMTEGCPGELEHPNSMNINLENVSHKIEQIQMNEDGTITGTILLLNTPKGQIAKAIVEGGLPLYISSRGAGSIDESGNVTLSTIKTYDLVGTPGFSQAKLALKENQSFECLNESAEDGPISWAIIDESEKDNEDGKMKEDEPKEDEPKDEPKEDESKEDEPKDEPKEDEPEETEPKPEKKEKKSDNDINMEDLKIAIDQLTDKVSQLEAELHIAKESAQPNYAAIEKWIIEEYTPEIKNEMYSEMANLTEKWVVEEFAPEIQNWAVEELTPEIQNWVVEEYSPEIQNWVVEELTPEIQNWVVEEYSPEIQNWITEEYSPEIQNWITEEYSPEVQNWVCEEFAPVIENWINEEYTPTVMEDVNSNLSEYLEAREENKYSTIDRALEKLASEDFSNSEALSVLEANQKDTFAGIYVVEHMPAQYRPQWEMLDEARKEEIVRVSRMYDFNKKGVLESFWANVEFNTELSKTTVNENADIASTYHNNIVAQMNRLRKNR